MPELFIRQSLTASQDTRPSVSGIRRTRRSNVLKRTLYNEQFVPRAVYNDPISELLLREEGPTGRKPTPESILELKRNREYEIKASGGWTRQTFKYQLQEQEIGKPTKPKDPINHPSSSTEVLNGDERIISFSEFGMDIINQTYKVPIHPIPYKAHIRNPHDFPIYSPSKHKALPPKFEPTIRSGMNKNLIHTMEEDLRKKGYRNCKLMFKKKEESLEEHLLRYMKTFEIVKEPEVKVNVRRAVSHRINQTAVSVKMSSVVVEDETERISNHLSTTLETLPDIYEKSDEGNQITPINAFSCEYAKSTVVSQEVVLVPVVEIAPTALTSTEEVLKSPTSLNPSDQKAKTERQISDSDDEDEEWLKKQKQDLYTAWGRTDEDLALVITPVAPIAFLDTNPWLASSNELLKESPSVMAPVAEQKSEVSSIKKTELTLKILSSSFDSPSVASVDDSVIIAYSETTIKSELLTHKNRGSVSSLSSPEKRGVKDKLKSVFKKDKKDSSRSSIFGSDGIQESRRNSTEADKELENRRGSVSSISSISVLTGNKEKRRSPVFQFGKKKKEDDEISEKSYEPDSNSATSSQITSPIKESQENKQGSMLSLFKKDKQKSSVNTSTVDSDSPEAPKSASSTKSKENRSGKSKDKAKSRESLFRKSVIVSHEALKYDDDDRFHETIEKEEPKHTSKSNTGISVSTSNVVINTSDSIQVSPTIDPISVLATLVVDSTIGENETKDSMVLNSSDDFSPSFSKPKPDSDAVSMSSVRSKTLLKDKMKSVFGKRNSRDDFSKIDHSSLGGGSGSDIQDEDYTSYGRKTKNADSDAMSMSSVRSKSGLKDKLKLSFGKKNSIDELSKTENTEKDEHVLGNEDEYSDAISRKSKPQDSDAISVTSTKSKSGLKVKDKMKFSFGKKNSKDEFAKLDDVQVESSFKEDDDLNELCRNSKPQDSDAISVSSTKSKTGLKDKMKFSFGKNNSEDELFKAYAVVEKENSKKLSKDESEVKSSGIKGIMKGSMFKSKEKLTVENSDSAEPSPKEKSKSVNSLFSKNKNKTSFDISPVKDSVVTPSYTEKTVIVPNTIEVQFSTVSPLAIENEFIESKITSNLLISNAQNISPVSEKNISPNSDQSVSEIGSNQLKIENSPLTPVSIQNSSPINSIAALMCSLELKPNADIVEHSQTIVQPIVESSPIQNQIEFKTIEKELVTQTSPSIQPNNLKQTNTPTDIKPIARAPSFKSPPKPVSPGIVKDVSPISVTSSKPDVLNNLLLKIDVSAKVSAKENSNTPKIQETSITSERETREPVKVEATELKKPAILSVKESKEPIGLAKEMKKPAMFLNAIDASTLKSPESTLGSTSTKYENIKFDEKDKESDQEKSKSFSISNLTSKLNKRPEKTDTSKSIVNPANSVADLKNENKDIGMKNEVSKSLGSLLGEKEVKKPVVKSTVKSELDLLADSILPTKSIDPAGVKQSFTLVDPSVLNAKATLKGLKCEIKVENMEMQCIDIGKSKSIKHFFPMELRRVVHSVAKGDESTVYACVIKKGGKEGSKFKKMTFQFESSIQAKKWSECLSNVVYGLSFTDMSLKSVVVLIDKFDGGPKIQSMLEKHMKPVFDCINKPIEFKSIQFSEFSVNSAMSALDFNKIGNLLCTNPEFAPRIQQILVRNNFVANPVNLNLEKDPVDAALGIIKSGLGSKAALVQISLLIPKVDESKFGSLFKKK